MAIALLAVALSGTQVSAVASCNSVANYSGVLYWCSSTESGSNMAWSGVPNLPRTTFSQRNNGNFSIACHLGGDFSDTCQTYGFTNGSLYDPTCLNAQNGPSCTGDQYAIIPSGCQVGPTWQC